MAARQLPHSTPEHHRRVLFAAEKPISHAWAPKLSLLPCHRRHRARSSSTSGRSRSLGAPSAGKLPGNLKLPSEKRIGWGARLQGAKAGLDYRGQTITLSVAVCKSDNKPMEEFPSADGPLELRRAKFSRQPHTSLSFIPVGDPAAASPAPVKVEIRTRRGRRFWKKTTSAEAVAGAAVGALCAVLALKGTTTAYENLASHPLTHDLPLGLTANVNNLLVTFVTAFGGFAVVMFGVSKGP